jgi:hypothetical protein
LALAFATFFSNAVVVAQNNGKETLIPQWAKNRQEGESCQVFGGGASGRSVGKRTPKPFELLWFGALIRIKKIGFIEGDRAGEKTEIQLKF